MTAKYFRNFQHAIDGNVALTVAFAALPMMIFVGSAIDYSRDLWVKTDLQAAVDTAALNTARQSPGLTTAQMLALAQSSVAAAFTTKGVGAPITTLTYTPASSINATIKITASAVVPTTFMNLVGITSTTVSASSTSTWGNTKLRVALALDNTGSMASSGKMTALKTATNSLLTSLKNAAVNDGDVYVSIIPFAKVVNVGTSNATQSWLSWSYFDTTYQTCNSSGKNCKPMSHTLWDGSIADRDQSYDLLNTTPSVGSTLFPAGEAASNDPTPTSLIGLTYDWTALSNEVAAMTPVGGTNQAVGLAWAWQSLTPGAPLNAPAKDPQSSYSDVIIILSDGINTEDRWYGDGTTYSAQVDARQKLLCDNIKQAGVTIYAVQVNTDNSPTAAALQYCASDPSKFVMLTSASQIITTFASIGASLSQLHLSH
ncbi:MULTISPECIES: pilus assembly protein TadG-related protein [unclassified Beijerinckia]|uniref:pilus assembly protein TadG-related protein n=1 Tax=unclassified Beijerinckia TaxID=2638183 RepID=UPI000899F2D9|nr:MULTISPECIES: pilus assembly protein TadG-related protein [unclassified Beijerinckia]MDH7798803.1 Flp pilus assembly protein TadG [Beijerinckia sp. GAS462]SED33789.1 Flp pilus assembly protein TadG [Beijerinckia sp. 28-YEA-48]